MAFDPSTAQLAPDTAQISSPVKRGFDPSTAKLYEPEEKPNQAPFDPGSAVEHQPDEAEQKPGLVRRAAEALESGLKTIGELPGDYVRFQIDAAKQVAKAQSEDLSTWYADKPGYTYGALLPFRKNDKTGEVEWGYSPESARAIMRAAGHTLDFDINNPEHRSDVTALALAMSGLHRAPGSIPSAPPLGATPPRAEPTFGEPPAGPAPDAPFGAQQRALTGPPGEPPGPTQITTAQVQARDGVGAVEAGRRAAAENAALAAPEQPPAPLAPTEPQPQPPAATSPPLAIEAPPPAADPWLPVAEAPAAQPQAETPIAPAPEVAPAAAPVQAAPEEVPASDLKPGDQVLVGDKTHEVQTVRPWTGDQVAVKLKDDPKLHIGAPDQPVQRVPSPEAPPHSPPTETAFGGPWTRVKTKVGEDASNRQGEPLYENANGVRATFDNGVPHTESVTEHPEKGLIPKNAVDRRGQFLTVEETGLGAAPPKPRVEKNNPAETGRKPAEEGQKPAEEWKYLADNEEGDPIYTNDQGVHSIVKDGVRIVETVRLRPTKAGMAMSVPPPMEKEPAFRPALAEKPEPKAKPTIEPRPDSTPAEKPTSGGMSDQRPSSAEENWWDQELTHAGRKQVMEAADIKRPDSVKWRHLSDDTRERLLATRANNDPAAEQPSTEVAKPEAPKPPANLTDATFNVPGTDEHWWNRTLTPYGRQQIMTAAGVQKLAPQVLWHNIAPEVQAKLADKRAKMPAAPETGQETVIQPIGTVPPTSPAETELVNHLKVIGRTDVDLMVNPGPNDIRRGEKYRAFMKADGSIVAAWPKGQMSHAEMGAIASFDKGPGHLPSVKPFAENIHNSVVITNDGGLKVTNDNHLTDPQSYSVQDYVRKYGPRMTGAAPPASTPPTSDEGEKSDTTPKAGNRPETELPASASSPAESVPAPGQTEPPTPEIVTHVTKKGKTLTGTIRRDLSLAEAKVLDPYAFKKDGGYFIRSKPDEAQKPRVPEKPRPGQVTNEMLAEYFTPGAIVHGYGGSRDVVVAFYPATQDKYWSVDVQAVGQDDARGRLRNHATMPSMRKVEQARRERAAEKPTTEETSVEQKPVPSSLAVAEQLVKKNQATLPGYDPDTGEMVDLDAVFADILANSLGDPNHVITASGLQAAAQGIYGGTLADGTLKRDRLYDVIELGVNTFITRHPERFAPTGDLASAQAAAAELAGLKDRIPTQTVRAGDKEKLQQFSTPPDYAFAVNWAANIQPGEVVIEPSAGTGGIAVHAMNAGAQVIGNEISPQRRAMMASLPFSRITKENAEQLHNILPRDIKPTVVVMNPPFSSAGDRMGGKMVIETGAAHIEQALKRLEPGGRLVAIVGDGMKPEGAETAGKGGRNNATGARFSDWWKKIGAEYDVRANIGVGGEIYRKYGTTFPTRLLVIDKVAPSGQPPVVTTALTSAELLDALRGVRDARPGSARQPVADQPGGAPVATEGQGATEPGDAVRPPTGEVGDGGGQDRPAATDRPKPAGTRGGQAGGVRTGTGPRPQGDVRSDAPVVQQPQPLAQGGDERPGQQPVPSNLPGGSGAGGDTSHLRPDGSDLTVAPPAPELLETSIVVPEEQTGGELTESVYENYQPQRITIEGAQPHPGPLVQSAAMASVLPPAVTYKTALPRKLITEGAVSAAQLEAIIYAGNAHSQVLEKDKDGVVKRRGFFIGDGTGVGKGREVAGIILDNKWQGRKKAVWVSEKMPLSNDAKRDWSGLGQNPNDILVHNKIKAGDEIKHEGILFTTYDTVKSGEKFGGAENDFKPGDRVHYQSDANDPSKTQAGTIVKVEKTKLPSWTVKPDNGPPQVIGDQFLAPEGEPFHKREKGKEPKTRVQQIVDWVGKDFDGVIAFDEAHNMANVTGGTGTRGKKEAAAKALAGLELQNALPNARVVYVSATGATEVSNLAYADRLGLWGPGTAFANRNDFLSRVASGGVAAMELVARDMKALGYYTARSLSYDGVEYDRVQHDLTPPQRVMYDKIADAWQLVLRNMMEALAETGADGKGGPKSAILSAFWGGHQRFFNQLITSLQMPSVIEGIDKDLAEGRQAVLQLVNTNEAGQERALDKSKARGDEDLEELDMSPRDQLLQLVDKAYPTRQYEEYTDPDGNVRVRPVSDSEGNPVHNPDAIAAKEKLLLDLGSLRVPDGPLEILVNHYGPEAVAEVTGRKQRVVNKADETGKMKKVLEKRGTDANVAEANSFQSGKKKILIFSQAGGTGRSYHDDKTADRVDDTGRLGIGGNGARRSHYLVQAGWRADTAVQGFGRTHRTNQWTAPIFHLVTTDLEGQKRFISSIARRLGQLGALTKGERRTGDQGMFGLQDNLESDEAKAGLVQLFRDIHGGRVEGFTTDDLATQMGLYIETPDGALKDELPPMTQFLNRVLSLKVNDQNRVFNEFATRFRDIVDRAAAAGTLDAGTETYKADKIVKASDQVVYTDPNSGAETRHVHLVTSNRNYPTSFTDLMSGQAQRTGWSTPEFFVQNKRSGYISAVTPTTFTKVEPNGQVTEHYRVTTPIDWQYVPKDELGDSMRADGNLAKITNLKEAKTLWDDRVAKTPEFKDADLHLITGAILPIWDRLAGSPRIYRLLTDAGERMLGRVVDNKVINQTLERLGAEGVKLNVKPAEVVERILDGGVANLANGWTIKRRRVAQEYRLELTGTDLYSHTAELEAAGVFRERIPGSYDTRYFIPSGANGAGTIEAITKRRPIISLEGD